VVDRIKHGCASVARIKVVEFGDVREDDEPIVIATDTSVADVCNRSFCVGEETVVENRTPRAINQRISACEAV
jgi:hypothetical protein